MQQHIDLHEVQRTLEAESISLGVDRYNAQLEANGETAMTPGMRLMRQAIQPLAKGIQAFLDDALSGRPGRDIGRAKYLQQFEPQNVAYITAKLCINAMNTDGRLQTIAMTISGMLEDTLNFDKIKAEDPKLYSRLLNKIASSASTKQRHVVMRNLQNKNQIATIKWGRSEKLALGIFLIRLMEQETHYFEIIKTEDGPKNTSLVFQPTDETQAWLEKSHSQCEVLSPVNMPMVVPPMPWNNVFGGGYLTKPLRYALIKTRSRNYLEEMKSWDMPDVYRAVNALQATPWRINKSVLNVMDQVWEGGGSLGKLPPRDNLPKPAQNYIDAEANPEAHKAWRRKAAQVFQANMKLRSKRRIMAQKLSLAEQFKDFDALYFPHVLDWRGRIYPVSAYLNPQSDDSGKALLQFSEGKPLGASGAYWLAIHGANCAGVDKVSFEDRVKWVEEHQEEILDSAFNPLDGQRFWATVGSPYQFLAFCFEWAGYTLQGESYVSHLPVSWDGSCNGLQNFSAMLKDEVGGKATNLIPSDTPSDIYSEVARAAEKIIEADLGSDNHEYASLWHGKVSRSLAKRPTMTMPYGASKYGFREQLQNEVDKEEEETGVMFEGDKFRACVYLAGVMEDAIGNVVIKAKEAMDWLKDAAKIAASDNLPIYWETPSGFLVNQDYRKYEGQRIDTTICGVRTQLLLSFETDALDRRKQSAGIAPNFVHSMDASHLVATVGKCLDAGVTSLAMVHDSYGTHAADAEVLSTQLRVAFIEQYTPDVLGGFLKQLQGQLPKDIADSLPPPPSFGTLELDGVMHSGYFFA
jgi:DNA-directed RNA polymerase